MGTLNLLRFTRIEPFPFVHSFQNISKAIKETILIAEASRNSRVLVQQQQTASYDINVIPLPSI